MATLRKSNIELLRIVSIVMVLIVHLDGASLGLPEPMGNITAVSGRDWWRLVEIGGRELCHYRCQLFYPYFGLLRHQSQLARICKICHNMPVLFRWHIPRFDLHRPHQVAMDRLCPFVHGVYPHRLVVCTSLYGALFAQSHSQSGYKHP